MPTLPLLANWLPIFNVQPGAALLLSPEWVIVGASDDYLAATLTKREVIVGQYIFDAFPDNPNTPEANAVANVRASLEQVMATRLPHEMAPQHYDVPDPARPGHFVERYWKPRHTPVPDAAGQVLYIIQSVQDITTRHLAERQLRDSQASEQVARAEATQQRTEFRHFIEQAPVAVAVYRGPEFRVELANATTLAIWDRPLEAVRGRPVFEALPEAATPEVVAIFERVFTTGIPHTANEQATTIYRHGRTEQVYWNIVFEPQHGPDGCVSGLFTVGIEVTGQVQARQQLEQFNQELEARVQQRTHEALALQADLLAAAQRQAQEREQFYQIFAMTPAAICVQRGPTHRYEYVNAAYCAFFPGRELLGRTVAEALPETVDSGVVDLLDHVYRTGETYFGYELPLLIAQPDGRAPQQMYFTFTYQAYRENGEIVGISTFAYNVAEQVEARRQVEHLNQELAAINARLQATNEELSQSNTRLTRTNVDLDNFIYTASHDLKQPIANIEGLLHAVEHELPPAGRVGQVSNMLQLMQQAVERFGRTVAHLTDISRLQHEHDQPPSEVPLARVVHEVQLDLAPLITQTQARVRVHIPADVTLRFSEKNLRSVVYNLLSNALKYHHPDRVPEVSVTYEPWTTAHVLAVRDNGLGLDLAHDEEKVFGMFKRLHPSVEGSGVGLYMVKKMVENAGGRIEIESELHQGSIFRVHFAR